MKASSRSSKLDILRVLLCACILICHFYPGCHALAGNIGVLGFFLLSGYLLQLTFIRMGDYFDVERFYIGKSKRLLPAFLFSIVLSLIVPLIGVCKGESFPVLEPGSDTFSVFRYIWYYNIATWYLGCLFVFILMAPFLWFLNRTRCGILCCFFCSFTFAAFLYWRHNGTSAVYMGLEGAMCTYPEVRLWQFVAGMVMCLYFQKPVWGMSKTVKTLLSSCLLLFILALSLWVSFHFRRGYDLSNTFVLDMAVVAFLGGLIVIWDDGVALASERWSRLLTWMASLTYGIYLFHLPVRNLLALSYGYLEAAGVPHYAYAGLNAVISVILAAALSDGLNRVVIRFWR